MNKYANLRQNYMRGELSEISVQTNPLHQFDHWFNEALDSNVIEPNAFILATVGDKGLPSARTLLLKAVEESGFVFYTNYNSDKAQDIDTYPIASMCFLWLELQRQVRITGPLSKVTREMSEKYFHSRPRESQIGAWVSPQSQIIESREFLETRLQEFTKKFEGVEEIPLPDFWGGYLLTPMEIEFWQGRPNRLHDRILYSEENGHWHIQRLAP